ncbi:MAG TPA: M10 family metallopeptidase C-terminal domain-containing protein [Roseiarcus sp.]|jgi:hypothetical protein
MYTAAEIQMIRNLDPGAVLPGIDTKTGNPVAASSLIAVAQLTQNSSAPYYYVPSRNAVYVTQAGAVLSGINFGSATVLVGANDVTIKDCTFTGTTGYYAVEQTSAYSGLTVENSTFTGTKSPTENNVWIGSVQGAMTIKDNSFINSPTDAIDMHSGVVSGNYFSGAGYLPGAHADAIWVTGTTGTTITDNFIDGTPNADSPANANSDIRLTNELGNLSNVTVSGNYLLGGAYTVEAGGGGATYTVSNVSITDNDIGFGLYGPFYPATAGVSETGNTIVDFTNPTPSILAETGYKAAGVPTAGVISATAGSVWTIASGSKPMTIFGNNIVGEDLQAGAGETNFVGGAGTQHLYGGQGVNIVTELAMSDRGDTMAGFDPAKDVIDLSHIDANMTTAGVQNFTFIGTAAFTGAGAQVRYQFDTTRNTTTVQVSLAGDTSADLTITLMGLLPLTAANFALTAVQSSADLTAGALATYSKVQTSGASLEYLHSNIAGRAYTSYASFSGPGYGNLAADELNLSSTAGELLLYDPNQTVSKGAAVELLQTGTGQDMLSYHPVETVDATTAGAEHFIFAAGFGSETIKGFAASGASADTLQLATSSFAYLSAGMSQAQDLTALLTHAASGSSGLTITDSHGDSLTLAGVSAATLAANPTAIRFA